MSTLTTNYKLIKPSYEDAIDVENFNNNFDIIDKALYNKVDYSQKDITEESQSIEIPVRLKYSFGLGRILGAYIAAGPQFTFLLGDDYCNDFATSLNTAIGVKLFKHIQVEAGYLFPLGRTMEILMDGGAPKDAKRKGWQLSLAYFF